MTIDENIDPDEILRDLDERGYPHEEEDEDVREVDFGNDYQENENYRDQDHEDRD